MKSAKHCKRNNINLTFVSLPICQFHDAVSIQNEKKKSHTLCRMYAMNNWNECAANDHLCWRMKTFRRSQSRRKWSCEFDNEATNSTDLLGIEPENWNECWFRVAVWHRIDMNATTYLHGFLKVNLITDSPIHAIHGIFRGYSKAQIWSSLSTRKALNFNFFERYCVCFLRHACIVCEQNLTDQRHQFNWRETFIHWYIINFNNGLTDTRNPRISSHHVSEYCLLLERLNAEHVNRVTYRTTCLHFRCCCFDMISSQTSRTRIEMQTRT